MSRSPSSFAGLLGFAALALVSTHVGTAHAEGPAASASAMVEGPGIKIGEGSVLHPILGVETGVISNVFREDDSGATSGILRLIGEIGVGSLSPQRLELAQGPLVARDGSDETLAGTAPTKGDFEYRADLSFTYDEYLTTNDNVRKQRDLAISAGLRAMLYPMGTWSIAFDDQFTRQTRPTNFESRSGIDRDINSLRLQLIFQPRMRTLAAALRFENRIDVFEADDHDFANRLQNTVGLRVNWQFLPVTRFFADASLGFFSGLGDDSTKVSSMPLRLLVGAQSAFTTRTTLNTRLGFGKGFYSSGPDFTNVLFGADLGYRYSPLGRVTFLYDFDFGDSINANYYRDHAFKTTVEHQFVPFVVNASAELRFRGYRGINQTVDLIGPEDRDDLIFALGLGGHYNFRDWFAATLNYSLVTDQTSYQYMTIDGYADDPSYTRHEFLVGVRAAL
jgi:Putative beta-barrel porin 2